MNKCILIIIAITFGLLVGCESELNKDINSDSIITNTTTDNTININKKTFYQEIKDFNGVFVNYTVEVYKKLSQGELTEEQKQEILNDTSKFLIQLKTFSPTPIISHDKLLWDEYEDLLYDTKQYTMYVQQYLIKNDEVYRSLMIDSYKDMEGHLMVLAVIEKQYY